eukprot:403346391
MDSTRPSTASSTQGGINQNLTLEQTQEQKKAEEFGCKARRTQDKVAMKVIRKECRGQHELIDQKDLVEIEIMSQINNPYINTLIDYYFQEDEKTQQEELILLQPLAMSDLKQFLECNKPFIQSCLIENYPEGRMPEKQAIEFLAQLAIGIKGMHDNKVIHRDLNPRNILVFKNDKKTALDNQEYILRISDFGCSRILKINEEEAMTRVGKLNYMPREQNSNKGYNSSVDIYSLGLTVFQMITGQVLDAVDILSKNVDTQYYSTEFIDLLYSLCSIDFKDRPSIDKIIENPLIQKSQTFMNCMLNGILPMSKAKINNAIDHLKNLQKVRTQFKEKELEWQAQYEMAFGNNDKQYFINKYKSENNFQNDENSKALGNILVFKRVIESNGNIFIGLYKDDNKFYGRYYEKDQIREGNLSNGKFQGQVSGFGISMHGYTYFFDGEYVDDKRNGQGVVLYSVGAMYSGEHKDGSKSGIGIEYWPNVSVYEGYWRYGQRCGNGVLRLDNGDTEVRTWKQGKQHGEIIKTYANGKQLKKTYDMGQELPNEEIKSTQ